MKKDWHKDAGGMAGASDTKIINDASEASTRAPLSVGIDYELYGKYLDEWDGTDEQKQAFLETLWSVVSGFVALGFHVHPIQQAIETSGQEVDLTSLMATDVISSLKGTSQNQFTDAADPLEEDCAERKAS